MRVDVPRLSLAAALAATLALAGCGAGTDGSGIGSKHAPAAKPKAKPAATVLTANGVVLTRDPEEQDSFPLPSGTRGAKKAPQPGDAPAAPRRKARRSTSSRISPGAPSDSEIRRELKQMNQALADLNRRSSGSRSGSASTTGGLRASVGTGAQAHTPIGAPDVIGRIISGGNAIANFPYIWGGGHGSFVDSGYDCSGSVSYALAAAGLLDAPLVSGQFAKWGASGPGKWVTIYANAGHVFMYVAGLRFDTSGRDGPFGSRWQNAPRSLAGFEVRHPPGL